MYLQLGCKETNELPFHPVERASSDYNRSSQSDLVPLRLMQAKKSVHAEENVENLLFLDMFWIKKSKLNISWKHPKIRFENVFSNHGHDISNVYFLYFSKMHH